MQLYRKETKYANLIIVCDVACPTAQQCENSLSITQLLVYILAYQFCVCNTKACGLGKVYKYYWRALEQGYIALQAGYVMSYHVVF